MVPPKAPLSATTSTASSVASMARKASSPTVTPSRTRTHAPEERRTKGIHSIPRATGITPDVHAQESHESEELGAAFRARGRGRDVSEDLAAG